MNLTYLRLICRPDKLRAIEEKHTLSCQVFGITILSRRLQSYWKDERCSEVNYEFSSNFSNEQWPQFFCAVFGADNNVVGEDDKAIMHTGSPILNSAEVFAYLFIEEKDMTAQSLHEKIAVCDECGSEYLASKSKMVSLCPECAHVLYGYENCDHEFKDGKCTLCLWDGSRSDYINKLLKNSKG